MDKSARDKVAARGYLYTLIGSACGGAVPVLIKLLLADNGPFVVTGLGVLISGLLLLFYKPRVKPTKASLPYLLYIGLIGAGIAPLFWATGLSETTVVNASLLANGEILFTTLIAFLLLGERLEKGQPARGLLILAGIILVSSNLELTNVKFLQGLVGNLLILGATLGWGIENNLIVAASKRFSAPLLSKFRNIVGGGLVMAFVAIAGFPLRFSTYDLVILALLALAISGTTYMFIAALQRLGAIRMILASSLSTVLGAAFALLILQEQITITQLLGGALIIAGVYLFQRSERPMFVP
jgi:drug/metabolite transporter (DMT)-like permease